ncbi:MAG: hypothetical protein ACP5JJ_19135 [Anaerolineae bacterium]
MTNETDVQTKGLVDAADRIARELISTPKFKQAVMILLDSIDPPAARRLVRTLFWQDPGLLLSVLGALPAFVNTGSEVVAEAARQIGNMPPPLLRDLLSRILGGIDGEAAGEAAGGLVAMVLSLDLKDEDGAMRRGLSEVAEGFGRGYAAAAGEAALTGRLDGWMAGVAAAARDKDSATSAFIQAAGKALRDNPDFVEHVLKPLLSPALEVPQKAPAKKAPAKKTTAKKAPAKKAPAKKAPGTGQAGKDKGGE